MIRLDRESLGDECQALRNLSAGGSGSLLRGWRCARDPSLRRKNGSVRDDAGIEIATVMSKLNRAPKFQWWEKVGHFAGFLNSFQSPSRTDSIFENSSRSRWWCRV